MQPRIKRTIICKEVGEFSLNSAMADSYTPVDGDVALFEVLSVVKH